jgi:hypothetical protein
MVHWYSQDLYLVYIVDVRVINILHPTKLRHSILLFFQQLRLLCFAYSMYDLSCCDGLNDFSRSIASTRYSPDNVRTQDRTIYSQFLNPVGHDVTIIASFDIPYRLGVARPFLMLEAFFLTLP